MTTASESTGTESAEQALLATPNEAERKAQVEQARKGTAPKKAASKKVSSKKASAKRSTGKSGSKKASSKKATAKKATAKAASKRSTFPELKTEAAAERVMKENLEAYKQYQVERDKNRNERGMEKHRLGYRTYKNAYTQLLGLRKKAGKTGRRNAKA